MLVELDLLKPCSEAWAAEGREVLQQLRGQGVGKAGKVVCHEDALGGQGLGQGWRRESPLPVAEILLSRDSWRCCCSITCLESNHSRHLELSVPTLPHLKAAAVVLLIPITLGFVCVEEKGLP
jgi:hypothetical protein